MARKRALLPVLQGHELKYKVELHPWPVLIVYTAPRTLVIVHSVIEPSLPSWGKICCPDWHMPKLRYVEQLSFFWPEVPRFRML